MIVKVCGMRDAGNIREVAAAGADWIGFIFHPKSPRYVTMTPSLAGIIPDRSDKALTGGLTGVKKVGVFVDDSVQNIITRIVNFGLNLVQLHGHESVTMIRNLRRSVDPDIRPGLKIIKALPIETATDFNRCRDYEGVVDYLLFDTRCKEGGGSGRQFDWSLLEGYKGSVPFLLSGGIGPDDAEAIRRIRHPLLAGVDLNSRFETAPGLKDAAAVRAFIERLRI